MFSWFSLLVRLISASFDVSQRGPMDGDGLEFGVRAGAVYTAFKNWFVVILIKTVS